MAGRTQLRPGEGFGRRDVYEDEHEQFREAVRRFVATEVLPQVEEWDAAGIVPQEAYERAAELGFLGMAAPERHGGAGVEDFRFNAVLNEEFNGAGATGFGLALCNHTDVCLPYLLSYANEEQRERWLPGATDGSEIIAIAMTEPSTGSDLAAIATRARPDGEDWIVDGSKTFISVGHRARRFITAVRTDPAERHRGLSLLVIEDDMEGFRRGRRLEKIGQHGIDTAELFFDAVRVPARNVLGEVGRGFDYLVSNLPQERMSIAIHAQAIARGALVEALDYVHERRAFGRPIADFQATRFSLAEAYAELEVSQAYLDRCLRELVDDRLTPEAAAVAKLWSTETQGKIVDRCLQLFGGYGYMREYGIARRYVDTRVSRIYGGTSEIMKEIIGRALRPDGG
jgi:alkylation response protein AidB-like acyl-CoA dehydrogenase